MGSRLKLMAVFEECVPVVDGNEDYYSCFSPTLSSLYKRYLCSFANRTCAGVTVDLQESPYTTQRDLYQLNPYSLTKKIQSIIDRRNINRNINHTRSVSN